MNNEKKLKAVNLFRILGDETRFQLVELLLEHDLCVGALARMLNVSKPAVSQHLKLLREMGLVKGEKRGYWTHYQVETSLLHELAATLEQMSQPGKREHICLRSQEGKTEEERGILEMCKDCCEQPEKLKIKPSECTPEQIKECHGHQHDHPCANKEKEQEE